VSVLADGDARRPRRSSQRSLATMASLTINTQRIQPSKIAFSIVSL
jgi:hypothetical protein